MGSGLLQKANLLNKEKGLAFSNFIQKYNKLTFAVFEKKDNYFFITTSLGFDGLSLLSSYSTIDFWDGLITSKNTVINFSNSDGTINKLLQFFSFSMKDKVTSVSIYKTDDNILLVCNDTISSSFIHDFTLLDYSIQDFDFSKINSDCSSQYKVNKYSLSYIDAVNSYVNEKANGKIYADLFKTALLNEISNRITNYFSFPNAAFAKSASTNNIVIFTKENFDENLLLAHLKLNLKDVIENCVEQLSIDFQGNAQTFTEIKDFFKVN